MNLVGSFPADRLVLTCHFFDLLLVDKESVVQAREVGILPHGSFSQIVVSYELHSLHEVIQLERTVILFLEYALFLLFELLGVSLGLVLVNLAFIDSSIVLLLTDNL